MIYYLSIINKKKEIEILKCDIDFLEKNLEVIKKYKTNNEYLKERIQENINGLEYKKVLLNALIWKVSDIDIVLNTLNEEEKKLIELRYKKIEITYVLQKN